MTSLRPKNSGGITIRELVSRYDIRAIRGNPETLLTGIELSSSGVTTGDLFAALPGAKSHGAQFVDHAIEQGALAVLTDEAGAALVHDTSIPLLVSPAPRAILGDIAAGIFDSHDSDRLSFGITGTNGKTSITYILASILESVGIKTALSTTAQRRIGSTEMTSSLTTPEAPELHAFLSVAREAGAGALALEVSAQALTRHRVAGVQFDVVCFANLSHDHLDDYASLDEYFAAKCELFSPGVATRGVVCVDDHWGRELVANAQIPVTTVSARLDEPADWHVSVTAESFDRTSFVVRGGETEIHAHIPLLGDFMAVNGALAIVMAITAGIPTEVIRSAVAGEQGIPVYIPGRLEVVSGPVGPVAVVDYGHTPEAFRLSLEALRRVTPGKIIMVFGADGDRDSLKRPELGAIAARLADVVIVTDYHPRSEDPKLIREALLAGARSARPDGEILEVPDPASAVREAVARAGSGDVVFYAGPGHEDYREVAGIKIAYDAREDVRSALREAGYPTGDVR
jgi:UDP-N-acetylmuramoyl-L-alanyl-D-glutamate--2,6-diaminopimelate ligase